MGEISRTRQGPAFDSDARTRVYTVIAGQIVQHAGQCKPLRNFNPVMTTEKATIFFLHIPKNSGTTLNTIIRENYRKIFKVSWDKPDPNHSANILLRREPSAFSECEIVRGHFPYGLHEALPSGAPYTYFTMLRDPVKRTWSQYNYLRTDSSYINKNPELLSYLKSLSLDTYCRADHPNVPNHTFTDNAQVRYLSGVGDSKPFGTIDEDDLALAKYHLDSMYFGVMEDFDRSMLHLQQALGWKRILYTRQKVGSIKATTPTSDEVESLKACNQFDVRLYEYGVKLFRDRTSSIADGDLRKYESQLSRHQFIERSKRAARGAIKGFLGGLLNRQRN